MFTSLLYHGFGIRGYHNVRTRYLEGAVVFGIERPREHLRCSRCGSADVHQRGSTDRTFRCLPIGGKPVFVEYSVPPGGTGRRATTILPRYCVASCC